MHSTFSSTTQLRNIQTLCLLKSQSMSHQVHWACLRKMANRRFCLQEASMATLDTLSENGFWKLHSHSNGFYMRGRRRRAGWNLPALICCTNSLEVISLRLLEQRHRHKIRDFLGAGGSQRERGWLSAAIWYKPSEYGHSSSFNHCSDGRHFLKKAGKPMLTSTTQNSWVCILGPKSLSCKIFPYSALQ